MKRFFTLLTMILLLGSCTKQMLRDELTELHSEIDELRSMLTQVNSNIEALQIIVSALQNNDYVTGVTPIVENQVQIGYTITFSQSGPIVIYHGKDGYSPMIGIEADPEDGVYYWTLDGKWLMDGDGKRIQAVGNEGTTPELKIEDGYWYISYDKGKTWRILDKATGEAGDSMFESVEISDDSVTFVLSDGRRFSIPRNARVRLILDIPDNETGVIPGSEIRIGYTLENATDSTIVTASSDGIYTVRIEQTDINRGWIFVQCPYRYSDGFINIMVSDGTSYSFLKVISFYEEKMILADGTEFHLSPDGGELLIPFSTNFDFRFEIEENAQNWISIISTETRSEMKEGELRVKVERNEQEWSRSGKINILPLNSTGDIYTEIIINQASAFFSIEQTRYSVSAEGETIETMISSSRGLSIRVPENAAGWLNGSIEDLGEKNYRLTTTITKNLSGSRRSASIALYSDNGSTLLGIVEFVQSSKEEEVKKNMIITVRANVSNDFTAAIGIDRHTAENYDFFIDWGDGQAERVTGTTSREITHRYEIEQPESFNVTISGDLAAIRNGESLCMTDIVQWGQTGLRSVNLSRNYMLETIAGCSDGEFTSLESISFRECPALTEIPEDLFADCRSLTNLSNTFYSCTGLTSIPEGLFRGCTNVSVFYGVFDSCTGITEIPEDIFEQCRQALSFSRTFYNCIGLKEIPAGLFSACHKVVQFDQTFAFCREITKIPENLFENCPDVTNFNQTFDALEKIREIPENLFRNNGSASSFNRTFSSCKELRKIPSGLFSGCAEATSFIGTFSYCSELRDIPQGLFDNCRHVETFSETFARATNLEKVPTGIFDHNRKVTDFSATFSGCEKYTGESPFTIIDNQKFHLYERHLNPDQFIRPGKHNDCFYNCLKLKDYSDIRQYWADAL